MYPTSKTKTRHNVFVTVYYIVVVFIQASERERATEPSPHREERGGERGDQVSR